MYAAEKHEDFQNTLGVISVIIVRKVEHSGEPKLQIIRRRIRTLKAAS